MVYKHIKYVKDRFQDKSPVGSLRSSRWPTVRKHFLALSENQTCAACGGKEKIEVHHIVPFHIKPELELEPTNLISLCESDSFGIICHLLIGHLGNYKNFNPNVKEDAKKMFSKLEEAAASSRSFLQKLQ